ncbi:MAG: YceI family protein [Terriglobales bacterium]|jgi:polyisoprenoid-binding protein YceI
MRRLVFALSVLQLCAITCLAQQAIFELDPARTTVQFTLGDVIHTVHGTFKAKSGKVMFDPSSGEASGEFVIDTTTGDTGNRTRDHKMHKEILESEKYPEASFTPTKIVGNVVMSAESSVQVQGTLRLHGADHPMTLTVPLQATGGSLVAKLHFVVPYVDWGLKDPSNFVLRVSKQVEVDITATGHYAPTNAQ